MVKQHLHTLKPPTCLAPPPPHCLSHLHHYHQPHPFNLPHTHPSTIPLSTSPSPTLQPPHHTNNHCPLWPITQHSTWRLSKISPHHCHTHTLWLIASHVPSTMHHSSTTCDVHGSNEQAIMHSKHATPSMPCQQHQLNTLSQHHTQATTATKCSTCPAASLIWYPFFCHLSATFVVMPLFHPGHVFGATHVLCTVHTLGHAHHQSIAHTTNHNQQHLVAGFHSCPAGVLSVFMSTTLLWPCATCGTSSSTKWV